MLENLDSKEIDSAYTSTAEHHFVNCRELAKTAKSFKDYIYAALELRLCIERLSFEYLVIFAHNNRDLTKSELKSYRPQEIIKRVMEEEPYLEKTIDFTNAYLEVMEIHRRAVYPDFDFIRKTYGQTNDFLHLQQTSELPIARKKQLIELIHKSLPKMEKYIRGRAYASDLGDHAKAILESYTSGKIDKDQMIRMVKISDLPDHMYNP